MSDILARFHQTLVEEIRSQRPDYLQGPFTVAEIYQNLAPYGTHRDRIGVEMNGDYEDALLRLLAGEGDYLVLESEHALQELREELESTNPNTGLYREFAAVDVRLNPDRLRSGAARGASFAGPPPDGGGAVPVGGGGPGAGRSPTAGEADAEAPNPDAPPADARTADASTGDAGPARLRVSLAGPTPDGDGPTDGDASTHPAACRWCRAELPRRDNLNFCPFCGTDVNVVPCASCGEELQPEWRFCVACGTEAAV